MTSLARTVIETALIVGAVTAICVGGWLLERYETRQRQTRTPPAREQIIDTYCEWRGIRHASRRAAQAAHPSNPDNRRPHQH